MKQEEMIKKACEGAKYYLVKYHSKEGDFGKIIDNKELDKINLEENEIYRSIENKNNDRLFVFDLKPEDAQYIDNPLQLLLNTLNDAKSIELMYPNIFKWSFNGLNITAYALVPSGAPKSHSTISRYGGTENFIKILRQHLKNISKMKRGKTPNYNFLNIKEGVNDTELSVGSINRKTDLYSIMIDLKTSYKDIFFNSKKCISKETELNYLDMKYWAREINPDFISEAKHIKLKVALPPEENIFALYPTPIKRIMELKTKGNHNRFLLARFLLAVHSQKDAKFVYYSIMGDEEREHIKQGNCSTQWNYILNNLERYGCPSMKDLESFIKPEDEKLSHPLEKIHEYMEKMKNEED